MLVILLFILIIPGAIAGMMRKRRSAVITLFIVSAITLTLGYGYSDGWFDDKEYKTVKEYTDGMAAVQIGNFISRKWGFIDETGKEVISPTYTEVLYFSEDLAAVSNGKWGFIDKRGDEVVPFMYDAARPFSEGVAAIRIGNEDDGKWGFIDKTGKEVVPFSFDSAGEFADGLAPVKNNYKWG